MLTRHGVTGRGRVLTLADARVLGHVFNPLPLWVLDGDDEVECVIAEVHNTDGERHRYPLRPDERSRAYVDKQFHVSPFLEMGGEYLMRVPHLLEIGAGWGALAIRAARRPGHDADPVRRAEGRWPRSASARPGWSTASREAGFRSGCLGVRQLSIGR